jgi:hypothetical protein
MEKIVAYLRDNYQIEVRLGVLGNPNDPMYYLHLKPGQLGKVDAIKNIHIRRALRNRNLDTDSALLMMEDLSIQGPAGISRAVLKQIEMYRNAFPSEPTVRLFIYGRQQQGGILQHQFLVALDKDFKLVHTYGYAGDWLPDLDIDKEAATGAGGSIEQVGPVVYLADLEAAFENRRTTDQGQYNAITYNCVRAARKLMNDAQSMNNP